MLRSKNAEAEATAIFQDGRCRHFQNRVRDIKWAKIARFWRNLVHRTKITCWVKKLKSRGLRPFFKITATAILEIKETI
jgi:hypothetical protein